MGACTDDRAPCQRPGQRALHALQAGRRATRQFMSPYGLDDVDFPELQRVYVFNVSNANSFRVIYMDGRGHPANLTPGYFGHSIGRREGDTLVIDTVGFNERFWMNRDGLPHTNQLHLVERQSARGLRESELRVRIHDRAPKAPRTTMTSLTRGYTRAITRGGERLFEHDAENACHRTTTPSPAHSCLNTAGNVLKRTSPNAESVRRPLRFRRSSRSCHVPG